MHTEKVLSFGTTAPARRWGWIKSPTVDVVSAFAWVPVFVVAHLLTGDALRVWASWIFLFSLVHQAVTPFLLATDRPTRSLHPVVYAFGIPAVLAGSYALTRLGLAWVAVVAATWNLLHTLRQRYGIMRLYGRTAGQPRLPIEQGLIFAPFLMTAALVVWLPNTLTRIKALGFGGVNREILRGVELVSPIAPVIFTLSAVWLGCVVRVLYCARANRPVSPAKQVYLLSYGLSLGCAVVNPAAGLLSMVAAHSFEYFFALDSTLEKRFGAPGTTLHRLIRFAGHRRVFLVVLSLLCAAGLMTASDVLSTSVYLLLYMTVGGSHFLFDGFMWKAPRTAS
jgi:hypothetical protein